MSLIRLHLNRLGHVELSFVNARILRRVLAIVVRNGGPQESAAYLQHDGDVQSLLDSLRPAARPDLHAGWDIHMRIDGWEAARYYGHDAHKAFER